MHKVFLKLSDSFLGLLQWMVFAQLLFKWFGHHVTKEWNASDNLKKWETILNMILQIWTMKVTVCGYVIIYICSAKCPDFLSWVCTCFLLHHQRALIGYPWPCPSAAGQRQWAQHHSRSHFTSYFSLNTAASPKNLWLLASVSSFALLEIHWMGWITNQLCWGKC